MKKLLLRSSILFFFANSFAQNYHGVAYYASQTQMKDIKISSSDMDPTMQEKLAESMKKAFEKTFVLSFNNFESVYQEEEKLEAPSPGSNGMKIQVDFSGGIKSKLYKNFKTKTYTTDRDIFGKEFLISDSLEHFKWEILESQKKIGNYTCYKAQIKIPVTSQDLKDFEEFKKKQQEGKTNFFTRNEPKEQIIEAWYTLDIPVSNGPNKYWGLPGLILELHEGNTTYLCSKIILNPEEKIEIKAPKEGKKVNQKEFDKIQEKKLKSMTNEDGVIEIRMN